MLNQYPQLQAEGFQESNSNSDITSREIRESMNKLCLADSTTELQNQYEVDRLKNIGSIFSQPTIIKTLGCKGNRQDLLQLKQLSSLYYQLLNSSYLDIVGKTITFSYRRQRDRHEDELFNNDEFKPSIRVSENYETYNDHSYDPRIPDTSPIWTWNPKLAHIFRKLELNSLWFDEPHLEISGINLNILISHLAPYITKLDLGGHSMSVVHGESPSNLLEFIQQFSKLRELSMHHRTSTGISSEKLISLDELEILFQCLPRRVHVKLTVYYKYYEPVLERFGGVDGITIFIDAFDHPIQLLIESIGNLKNVKFYIFVYPKAHEIVQFTSLCLKHKDKVNISSMYLNHLPGQSSLDETIVNRCLVQLSPFITYLSLGEYYQMSIFTPDIVFPRITCLQIRKWEHSLDFLFGCPELRALYLTELDQDLSIFRNPEKSHKEALMEVVGKLKKLRVLDITSKSGTVDRIGPGTELGAYLKELLPDGACVCNY